MQKSIGQLLRYGLIGVATNLIGYLIYLAITYAGMEPKLAMSLLYLVGTSIGFYLNRSWTFAHEGSSLAGAYRFACVYFAGYLLNLLVLYVFVDRIGYPHQWVQAGAILLVAVFLFTCLKWWVFPASNKTGS